jgi:hypothetical protein
MSISPPVLLRRIVRLEATVGRLEEDLGRLRSLVRREGVRPKMSVNMRRRSFDEVRATEVPGAGEPVGLAGAEARGEAARVQWVNDGLVVPGG